MAIYGKEKYYKEPKLQLISVQLYEFGPVYLLLDGKNKIYLKDVPHFNPSWNTFVVVDYKEAGPTTYGIEVWHKNSSAI